MTSLVISERLIKMRWVMYLPPLNSFHKFVYILRNFNRFDYKVDTNHD